MVMLKQPLLKTLYKTLITIAAYFLLSGIGIGVYLYINNPDRYLSSNPDEAMPQLYVALTNKLESNPSREFIADLNQAYVDQVITESEYIRLTLKYNLSMATDLNLEFKTTKQQFHKTWLNYQNVES